MKLNRGFCLTFAAGLAGCAGHDRPAMTPNPTTPAATKRPSANVLEVERRLLGRMDSSEHALLDPSYFDVTLKHCSVQVQDAPADERYLLLEQAISVQQDRPYRVRFVRLRAGNDESVAATTFEPPDGEWRGRCSPGAPVPQLMLAQLGVERCTNTLVRQGADFVGSTPAGQCASSLRGASYVTTEIRLGEGVLHSWDRGFSADGEQVWGARDGGYSFRRVLPQEQHPYVVQAAAFMSGRSSNAEQLERTQAPVYADLCPVQLEHAKLHPHARTFYAERGVGNDERDSTPRFAYAFAPGDEPRAVTVSMWPIPKLSAAACSSDAPTAIGSKLPQLSAEAVDWTAECQLRLTQTADDTFVGSTAPNSTCADERGPYTIEVVVRDGVVLWTRCALEPTGHSQTLEYKRVRAAEN